MTRSRLATPNGAVRWSAMALVAIFQAALVVVAWSFSAEPLPRPAEVASAWLGMMGDGLLWDLKTSLSANAEALAIATAISLSLAYSSVVPAMRPIVGAVAASRHFGATGFVVFFALGFGAGHGLRVAILVFCIVPFFTASMASSVAAISREEWDQARVMGMGPWRSVWEIVIIGKADVALETLRQNAAIGWMAMTMVEGLSRSEGGLGVRMLDHSKHFQLASVLAIQATVFVVGLAQDRLLVAVGRAACPWSTNSRETFSDA